MKIPTLIAASVFIAAALPTVAFANDYVQTMTCQPAQGPNRCDPGEEPRPVRWFQQNVEYRIHDGGSQNLHPGEDEITDEIKHAVVDSFDAWNEVECSDFEMTYGGTTTRENTGYDQSISHEDNINLIVWRDGSWPHPGYHAVALATVTYRPSSGKVLSADIELNTAEYHFTHTEGTDGAHIDLQNTLTHEVGHFLGLDHSSNPAATMFETAEPGEISKRQLHQVDIDGLCFIYPEGGSYDPADHIDGYEQPPQNTQSRRWCSAAGSDESPALPALLLLVIGFLALRRSER